MILKKLFLGTVVGSIAISGTFVTHLHAESAELTDYARVCKVNDNEKLIISTNEACAIFAGDLRGRYHLFDSGYSAGSKFDFRGRIGVDARSAAGFGTARTFLHLSLDENGVLIEDAFAEIVGFKLGKFDSFGNLTFGNYALNANHGLYHIDNSAVAFGYHLKLPFGTNLKFGIESPTEDILIPDFSGSLGVDHDWGIFTIAGGSIALLSEGTKYNPGSPNYVRYEDRKKGDITDLKGFGFFGGAGGELNIPRLSSTKIGLTGFYTDGAMSKFQNTLPNTFKFVNSRSSKVSKTKIGTDKESQYSVSSEKYQKIIESLKFVNKNYYVREISNSGEEESFENELIKIQGLAANFGLTHGFNKNFKFNVNGGLFLGTVPSNANNDSDGRFTTTGTYLSTSFDYIPLEKLTISLGFEHQTVKFSYEGSDDNLKKYYEDDRDGLFNSDPEIAITISVTQSF